MRIGNDAAAREATPGSGPGGPGQAGPGGPGRLARAGRVAGRLVLRHKLITGLAAVFVVAAVAVGLATSAPGGSPPAPVAAGFTLASLPAPGQHITLSQSQGKP